jgi:hypothetical protein
VNGARFVATAPERGVFSLEIVMALPSQMARTTDHRSHMYRRHRARRGPMLAALIAIAAVAGIAWAWMRWDDEPETGLDDPSLAATDPSDAAVEGQAEPAPREPAPAVGPSRLVMGEQAAPPSRPLAIDTPRLELKPESAPMSESEAEEVKPTRQPSTAAGELKPAFTAGVTNPAAATANPAQRDFDRGLELMKSGKLVEARRILTAAHDAPSMPPAAAKQARSALAQISSNLVFGPEVHPADPFAFTYVVREGDVLARIVAAEPVHADWRFIQSINRLARPESLQVGQKLKLVRGPFHVIVHKADYRLDAYLGEGTSRVLVASMPVGLGEFDSTPPGRYRVKKNSKLIDPEWRNPRTGEHFASGDPMNPLGGYWIGVEGIDEANQDLKSYGLHGTIEPETIGQQKSMGCVRLLPDDIKLLYQMLIEDRSTVTIVEN